VFLKFRSDSPHQQLSSNRGVSAQQYTFSSSTSRLPQLQSHSQPSHLHQQTQSPPSQQPIMCNVGTSVRQHGHKRRYGQPVTTHDVAVGVAINRESEAETHLGVTNNTRPESSWAKLELCTSVSNLSQKHQAAAESRNERLLSRYERIDRIAMWLFPIFFFLFNICYWSYYLLLDDVLQDLW